MFKTIIILLAPTLAVGCFQSVTDPSDCSSDEDCNGAVCTRTNECVVERNVVDIRITWTVNGSTVSPNSDAACAEVDMLSVHLVDFRVEPDVVYRPVPCNLGVITYDRMPNRFDEVALTAWNAQGRQLDTVTRPLTTGNNIIEMNLQP